MSCEYCDNYPRSSYSATVYDRNGYGALLLDISSGEFGDGFAPFLWVNKYAFGINTKSECLGKAGINYCPWCGRDLRGSDEPELDEEPNDGKAQAETATPDYYTAHGVEAIDVIEAVCNRAQLAPDDVFCLGNVLKYALRAGRKGGTEADFESDCAKAANYAHRMVADGWLDQDGGAA